jgi:thioredoxin 2
MKKKIKVYKFWASWCAPCKMLAPIFASAAEEYSKKLDIEFEEINAEEHDDLASWFKVRRVPTIIMYDPNTKKEISRLVSLVPPKALGKWIEESYASYVEKSSESL